MQPQFGRKEVSASIQDLKLGIEQEEDLIQRFSKDIGHYKVLVTGCSRPYSDIFVFLQESKEATQKSLTALQRKCARELAELQARYASEQLVELEEHRVYEAAECLIHSKESVIARSQAEIASMESKIKKFEATIEVEEALRLLGKKYSLHPQEMVDRLQSNNSPRSTSTEPSVLEGEDVNDSEQTLGYRDREISPKGAFFGRVFSWMG